MNGVAQIECVDLSLSSSRVEEVVWDDWRAVTIEELSIWDTKNTKNGTHHTDKTKYLWNATTIVINFCPLILKKYTHLNILFA